MSVIPVFFWRDWEWTQNNSWKVTVPLMCTVVNGGRAFLKQVAGEDRHWGFPLISVVTHTCDYIPPFYKQMGVNNRVNDSQL